MYSSRTKNWFQTQPRFTLWSGTELPASSSFSFLAGVPRRPWGRRTKVQKTTESKCNWCFIVQHWDVSKNQSLSFSSEVCSEAPRERERGGDTEGRRWDSDWCHYRPPPVCPTLLDTCTIHFVGVCGEVMSCESLSSHSRTDAVEKVTENTGGKRDEEHTKVTVWWLSPPAQWRHVSWWNTTGEQNQNFRAQRFGRFLDNEFLIWSGFFIRVLLSFSQVSVSSIMLLLRWQLPGFQI